MRQFWGDAWNSIWPLVSVYVVNLVSNSQSVCETVSLKIVEFEDLLDVYVFNMSDLVFLSKNLTYSRKGTMVPPPPAHPPRDKSVCKEKSGCRSNRCSCTDSSPLPQCQVHGPGPVVLTRAVSTLRARTNSDFFLAVLLTHNRYSVRMYWKNFLKNQTWTFT